MTSTYGDKSIAESSAAIDDSAIVKTNILSVIAWHLAGHCKYVTLSNTGEW